MKYVKTAKKTALVNNFTGNFQVSKLNTRDDFYVRECRDIKILKISLKETLWLTTLS